MPNTKKSGNNIFQNIVRTVVREELGTVEKRLDHRFTAFEGKMDDKFSRFENGMDDKFTRFEKRMDNKFADFEETMNDKLESTFGKYRNEIMTTLDQIMGMFKKHDEDHIILSSQHGRLINVEEKVEKLEEIRPMEQHL